MRDLPESSFFAGGIVGMLLGLAIGLLFCVGARAQDTPLPSASAIPDTGPLSVILIENCDHTPLTMFATMPDGTILMFDRHSGNIDLGELNRWALSATGRVLSASLPCGNAST